MIKVIKLIYMYNELNSGPKTQEYRTVMYILRTRVNYLNMPIFIRMFVDFHIQLYGYSFCLIQEQSQF